MLKELETLLLKQMNFTTLIISCEICKYWREINKKCGYASLCAYNNIGYIEVNQNGRCDKFKRLCL